MTDSQFILVAGALLVAALGAAVVAARLRLPALLLILLVGMAAGSDGAGWLSFDNYELARRIGTIALALILFDGGLSSGWSQIRPVIRPALLLSLGGTLITAIVAGLAASALFGLSPVHGMLLGSILAATDTAAVFGLVHGSSLRGRLARTLEGEAGFNDPVAVLLVLGFVEWIRRPDYSVVDMTALFAKELVIGAVCGYLAARAGGEAFRRIRMPVAGLYPVATFAVAAVAFGTAASLSGSGFLAVYVAGLMLGDAKLPARHTIAIFHDALAWIAQVGLFLTLGLLVFPSQLGVAAAQGLLLWLVITFVARPLAVAASTLFDRFSRGERVVLAAAGMRGGMAVLLATFPVTSGIHGSVAFFNVVFLAVVLSTLLQGPTFEPLARRLGLTVSEPALPRPLTEFGTIRGLGAEVVEFQVMAADGIVGRRVGELGLPKEATLTLIVRGSEAVPPRPSTVVKAGDELHLVVREEVASQLRQLLDHWRNPVWAMRTEELVLDEARAEPWQEDDGDPADPDLVEATPVIERLRVREDAVGALVVLEDGRYAVTGPARAVGSADAIGGHARHRFALAATDAERYWWDEVARTLAAEAAA